MISLQIQKIAQACRGQVIPEKMGEAYVRSVEIDSRKIMLGSLFLPIIGERVDGHDFIEQAFGSGAVCALSDQAHAQEHIEKLPYGKALIVVENTETALEQIAEYYRSLFDIPVVGVTGSVGKTSCKDFIAAALSGGFKVLKTTGNHNNNIGMPLTLFELDETYQAAVMEMGMDHFGEITRLSRTARPKVGVITNIGISHLENLGSREGILKAKLEITDYLAEDGILFLNGDDERLNCLKGKRKETIEYFGWGEHCDCRILSTKVNANAGLDVTASYKGDLWEFSLPTPGLHMALNAMPAIMTGCFLGLDKEQILRGLASCEPAKGRLNLISTDNYHILDDCYNASPMSMKGALEALIRLPGNGRRVAILGDMYELGAEEENGHREVGREAVKVSLEEPSFTELWTIGPLGRWIAEEASSLASGLHIRTFDTPADLIQELPASLRKGDTILVKASNGFHLSQVVEAIQTMDGKE